MTNPTGDELREALRDVNYRIYSDSDLKIKITAKKKLNSAITELEELRKEIVELQANFERACQEAQEATPTWMHNRVVEGNMKLREENKRLKERILSLETLDIDD